MKLLPVLTHCWLCRQCLRKVCFHVCIFGELCWSKNTTVWMFSSATRRKEREWNRSYLDIIAPSHSSKRDSVEVYCKIWSLPKGKDLSIHKWWVVHWCLHKREGEKARGKGHKASVHLLLEYSKPLYVLDFHRCSHQYHQEWGKQIRRRRQMDCTKLKQTEKFSCYYNCVQLAVTWLLRGAATLCFQQEELERGVSAHRLHLKTPRQPSRDDFILYRIANRNLPREALRSVRHTTPSVDPRFR